MIPTLTILSGIPASGKTRFAQGYLDVVVVCPDDYRLLLGNQFHPPAEGFVWSLAFALAHTQLKYQKKSVAIDATNTTVAERKKWIQLSYDVGVEIECRWFDVSLAIAMKRNAERENPLPDEVMERMAERYETPSWEEGFTTVVRNA